MRATYKYWELANEVLESAVDMYEAGKYAASIVLSSAAEDVFGEMFLSAQPEDKRKEAERQLAHKTSARIFQKIVNLVVPEAEMTEKELVTFLNRAPNELKHGGRKSREIELDLETDAFLMLERAVKNRFKVDRKGYHRWISILERHHGKPIRRRNIARKVLKPPPLPDGQGK